VLVAWLRRLTKFLFEIAKKQMCKTKPGESAHDVVVYLQTTGAPTRVDLKRNLKNVVALRLVEVAFKAPVGTSKMWRLNFNGQLSEAETTNANGTGFPIFVDTGATSYHFEYTNIREISVQQHGFLNSVLLSIADANGTVLTFDEAILYFTFITRDEMWDDMAAVRRTFDVANRSLVNDTRVPDETFMRQ